MNPTTEDVKDLLASSAASVDELIFGTNLFIGAMPDYPDLCACLYDTGGPPPDEAVMGTYYPTFQARVRDGAGGYKTGYALAQSIRNALHGLTQQTVNGTRYIYMYATSDILHVGKDEKDRPLFTINFRAAKTG